MKGLIHSWVHNIPVIPTHHNTCNAGGRDQDVFLVTAQQQLTWHDRQVKLAPTEVSAGTTAGIDIALLVAVVKQA